MLNRRVLGGFIVVAMVLAAGLPAAATNIPNWPAPATWSPQASSGGGRTALALVPGPPVPLIPVTPCRVMDTRTGQGQLGNFGPPALGVGITRTISIPTHTVCTGVPTTVAAYSLNVTVTGTGPGTFGYLQVWPTGQPQPTSSTINYSGAGVTLSNAAVVQAGTSGQINVFSGNQSADVTIDINGYYAALVGASPFVINSTGGYAIVGTSSTNVGVWGLGPTAGVFGFNSSGVGRGVYGLSSAGIGVYGLSSTNMGVKGDTSAANGLAGVLGSVGGAAWAPFNTGPYGVRGISQGGTNPVGVGGEGINAGGMFLRVNTLGTLQTRGYVGYLGSDGFYSQNNLTVTGTKSFVEPHPTDPTQVIKYVALEGPEAGTYFRGRGRFVGGRATIDVPDNFRMVTDTEGLTVQVTPIGAYSQVYVESQDLNQIVIRGSRDVEFSCLVQGVRRAFRDFKPIQSDSESLYFRPQTPDAKLNQTLPEELRQRLIASGIYNPDGTVNTATAERMGWAQKWRDDEAKAKAEEAAAAKAK